MSELDPRDLPGVWRHNAKWLRDYSPPAAKAMENLANELEDAFRSHDLEALTLTEAAEESGYSDRHLRRMLNEGQIENAGGEGSPRIRRQDLPRKAAPAPDDPEDQRDNLSHPQTAAAV